MKQFMNIYKFELKSYLKNKIFLGVTIALLVVIMGALSFPRGIELFENDDSIEGNIADEDMYDEPSIIMVYDETVALEDSDATMELFASAFTEYEIIMTDETIESLKESVQDGDCESAIIIHSPTEYTYIVNDVTMYDSTEYIIQELLGQKYQIDTMVNLGLSMEEAGSVLNVNVEGEVITLGKNQMDNFFYTYILIFGLYMVVLLYGQLVATSVATEKSSRAMELLITNAKTDSLMFGKVLGAGTAGLFQVIAVLGSSYVFYSINESYWQDNYLVQSMFDMPLYLLIYTVIFFILGFAIYSFLYGAIGSLASKVEDINTSSMPVTFLFIISFFITIFSMTSGNIDSTLMKVASFVPFTSPVAMFARIAMGNVPFIEIIISIVILVLTTVGIGILSARIYRLGVLMYGNPPKLGKVIKLVIKRKK
ncbi:MAG: ABC transporter permease [Eubacteriales bacterium]